MAACVLCRRLLKLRRLPGLRQDFTQAQHTHVKQAEEADEEEARRGLLQLQDLSPPGGYRLSYNPSTYHHSVCNLANSRSHSDNEEDECVPTFAPSFWQQNSRYSVSCSRHLSSAKNTLLDLAFNKDPEPERKSVSLLHRKPIPPDVKVDARAFLKCRPEYASITHDLTQRPHPIEWDQVVLLLQKVALLKGNMKPTDVSEFLVELSRFHADKISLVRSDQRFNMLLRYSVEHLRLFTPLQLLEMLQAFVWLGMPSSHSVLGLYEAELCRWVDQLSLHQMLFAADLWRCLGRQVPQFLEHLYKAVHRHFGQMGIPELIHLLYIIGEGRRCPKELIHSMEKLLMLHLDQLHPEEIGTVCLALFKSQNSISESAVTHLVDKALSEVEEMSDFAMVNVLKYLRFSYLYHAAWMEAMTQEVPRRAHRMGVQGLMHVTLTSSALRYRNDKILMAVAERVPSVAPHCRSKDSCKLLWAFGSLGFPPAQNPAFYQSLTEALRHRKVEFQRYPEHLLSGLLGLAFVSQFPEDLIALALSPEFVKLALKSTQLDLKKDLFTLDGAVALELPQWTGPRLRRELKAEAAEMLWKFAQSDVCQKPEVQEAESALQDLLGGEKFVCKRMILPHTRSIDLEVHLDPSGTPLPVTPALDTAALALQDSPSRSPSRQGWKKMNVGVTLTDELLARLTQANTTTKPLTPPAPVNPTSLHRVKPDEGDCLFDTGTLLTSELTEALIRPNGVASAPPEGIVKLAIQVSSRNHNCIHSEQLMGLQAMKRRHLKLAGYKVVELSYQSWFPMLRKSRTEKLAYLHCKVYNSL